MAKNGIFDELIKKLKDANAKIAECEAVAEKLGADESLTAEQKQMKFMDKYNEAILSFVRLPQECERLVKTQKACMWRNKEFKIKQFFKI